MKNLRYLAFILLAACGSSADSGIPAGPQADAGGGEPDATPQYCDKMDIVFVIDNSDTMKEEQENLIANFPAFVEVLDGFDTKIEDTPLDYRVAVTTTSRAFPWVLDATGQGAPVPFDMEEEGDSGAFRQSCEMAQPWMDSSDPRIEETFACAAEVGIGGSRFEMPLYNLELAFSSRVQDGSNSGFVRDDALLAVVILTDEDDCSRSDSGFTVTNVDYVCDSDRLTDPTALVPILDNLKGSRTRWTSAVIAGPGPGECSSELSNAEEAIRLKEFVQEAGDNSVFSSICEDDLSGALSEALGKFQESCQAFDRID
jgi:hypothetical protein